MRKNRTTEKAHEVRTTAVKMTRPKSLEELLKSFHDCRDCQSCIPLRKKWACEQSLDSPVGEMIIFNHHYITPCEKFTQKEK